MSFRSLVLVFLTVAVAITAFADDRLLFEDAFTDGGYTDGTDPLDGEWTASGATLSITNAELTAGGGNALHVVFTKNDNINVPFESITLESAGDTVSLEYTFKAVDGFTADNMNIVLEDTDNGAAGYRFQLGLVGGSNKGVYNQQNPDENNIGGKANLLVTSNLLHTTGITLERLAMDEVLFTFDGDLFDESDPNGRSRTVSAPVTFTVNNVEIRMAGNLAIGTMVIDDVKVTTNVPLPNPTGTLVILK